MKPFHSQLIPCVSVSERSPDPILWVLNNVHGMKFVNIEAKGRHTQRNWI